MHLVTDMNPDVELFFQELVRCIQTYMQQRHQIVQIGEMYISDENEHMWDLVCPERGDCGWVFYTWYASQVNDQYVTIGEGGNLPHVLFSELDQFFMSS